MMQLFFRFARYSRDSSPKFFFILDIRQKLDDRSFKKKVFFGEESRLRIASTFLHPK